LDLEMPGPSAWFAGALGDAVRRGELDESVVDGQVRHVLRLMGRVGILDGGDGAGRAELEDDDAGRRAVARQVVTEGTVLLHNDGLLPLDVDALRGGRVAVIGPNSGMLEAGGGSSEVTPHLRRRVYEAVADRLPGVEVVHEIGCRIERQLPTIDVRMLSGEGLTLSYFDNPDLRGDPVGGDVAHLGRLTWVGAPTTGTGTGLVAGDFSVRVQGDFVPEVGGLWRLGLESAGCSVWRIDGEVVVDNSSPTRGQGFYGAGSALVESSCALEAGRTYSIEVDVWPRSSSSPVLGVRLAAERPVVGDEFAAAVAAAREADVAVVVVGSNRSWESEGFDRPDLSLPGRQRELVEAVCAANPRTVVVVNAGSPVEMGWADVAGAVLLPWYPGEEGADAIADMLVGLAEPSGRLPVTIPRRIEDTPAFGHYPGDEGRVVYGEGVLVGYRHYDTRQVEPLFPFGHGLSYTSFAYGPATLDGRVVTVEVTNSGARSGSEVVQVYVHPLDIVNEVERPDRELAAFVKVSLQAGESASVAAELDDAAFSYWDVDSGAWVADPGRYEVLIGSSSRDIRASVEITL
jgi:beta-glucosidase